MKLEISLFKFDSQSDYLPYYTKHFLKIENEKTLLDILNTINETNEFSYEKCDNFDLVINGVYVKASLGIKQVVENFGKDFTIEPISIRRVSTDFLIDDNDFMEKMNLLDEFIYPEDEVNYKSLKQYYYASNTLNYKYDYIGDAILILASDLIKKNPSDKNNILKVLDQCEVGASYYTSLKNRILDFDVEIENKIIELQKMLNIYENNDAQNFKVNTTLIVDFGKRTSESEIKHDFADFNIAYYSSNASANEILGKLNANMLKLDTLKLDLAKNTFNDNSEITHCVANTIMLDAFDTNADFLLVDNDDDFYIFDYNRKALEKISGREVILPVIHVNELDKLAYGLHKEASETLVKHQINPEIV